MTSGIICTWNDLDGLKDWAKSYKKQTTRCAEMLVIDGGSSDGSCEFIKALPLDWNIRWIEAKKGNRHNAISPISECRNLGIKNSIFEKLIFFDTGCYYPKNYVEKVSENLKRCDVVAIWNQAVIDSVFTRHYNELFMPAKKKFKNGFIASSRGLGLSKTALIKKNWYYPTQYFWSGEDTYFFKGILERDMNVCYLNDISVLWRCPQNIEELYAKHRDYAMGRVKHGFVSITKTLKRILIALPYYLLGVFCLKFKMKFVVNWVNLEQDILFFTRKNG